MTSSTSCILSQSEQEKLIHKLEIFKIEGRDKHGHAVLRIIGKHFPARHVGMEAMNKYLEEKIFPQLRKQPFSVVYFHTGVQRCKNFPGISSLRSIYEAIPANVRENLQAVYFVHPGLQSRLFLAIFGRLLFTGGLYGKVKYVNRLHFLWDNVKRKEIEIRIPEYIYDYDEELDCCHAMEYALESDHPRVYCAPTADSPISTYSTRCIA